MPVKKVCPCCGAVFQCRHDNILLCHCATVKLDSLQRAYIKEHFPGLFVSRLPKENTRRGIGL
ncbi:hypothetical protein NXW84_05025 [Bacteroides fragilis]|nr:hypothetical protein NXW84_05025 [Bacteroides fragilis]